MKSPDVVMVDYGMGNLLSVRRGVEHCGASIELSSNPDQILNAQRVILPGVGAFADGMAELKARGLDQVLKKLVNTEVPVLGICLGMQMLMDESDEFGVSKGLGLIPGRVVAIPTTIDDGGVRKIPHIGWNSLVTTEAHQDWKNTILQDIGFGDAVYFVHSFMAVTDNPTDTVSISLYNGIGITAAIQHKNIYGCQFHPEKSGEVGLKILRRFLSL